MLGHKKLIYRIVIALLIASLTFTSVGCRSVIQRLVPEHDPAATSEPTIPDADTTPVVSRPTSRPVPRAERPTGVISTQAAETVASEIIDTSGGTIRVEMPGDPIDGLVLEVPAESYPDPREFTISSSTIVDHTFGDTFNPLSPLITIENGGDYSDEFMTVTVPIDLPDGWFAMPFYYDEATGTLEGIPFNSLTEDSITVVTRHFSSFTISGILNSTLDGLVEAGIDSGFRPGVDDWQFTNYGSYIAPGGHCAGQALTALWYYCVHPDGEDSFLWGLYDNNRRDPPTPALWQDDSYGYRLASTIQKDIDWDSFQNDLMLNLAGVSDELAFKAFAYGIYLTGEPQEVGIFASAGGGHDMITYRVDPNGLAIADPNFPGNTQLRIEYSKGAFEPYTSGASAAEIEAGNVMVFETIQYCAKSATIDWEQIGARWQEFGAGTIGNDRFPQYQVLVVHDDDTREPLIDGYESEHDRISIAVTSPGVHIGSRVYRDGQVVPLGQDRKYALEDGYNLLGFEILGDVNQDPNNRRWRYIDLQYINVWYGPGEEPVDCRGWVLESVNTELAPTPHDDDPYRTGFQLNAQEDSYVASGRFWVGPETNQSGHNIWVEFTHTGSWTPPPSCIPYGEKGSITLTATSDLAVVEGTPEEWGWGSVWNTITIDRSPGLSAGMLSTSAGTEGGETASLTVEFDFDVGGTPRTGLAVDLIVRLGTEAGYGQYIYTYVFQE